MWCTNSSPDRQQAVLFSLAILPLWPQGTPHSLLSKGQACSSPGLAWPRNPLARLRLAGGLPHGAFAVSVRPDHSRPLAPKATTPVRHNWAEPLVVPVSNPSWVRHRRNVGMALHRHLWVLLWKNLRLRRRRPWAVVVEIGAPLVLFLLLAWVRTEVEPEQENISKQLPGHPRDAQNAGTCGDS